jgi:hypothetical protein
MDLLQHLDELGVIFRAQAFRLIEEGCWIRNGCDGMGGLQEHAPTHAHQRGP